MSRYFGIPLRNGLPLGLGAVATLRSGGASGPANSATNWYFAALGLTGTPWADVSRTGLGTRVDSAGLVGFGPHNLALNSKLAGAVAGSPGTAPTSWSLSFTGGSLAIGSADADGNVPVTFSATNARQVISQVVTVAANTTYRVTVSVGSPSAGLVLVQALQAVSLPSGASVTYEKNGVAALNTSILADGDSISIIVAVAATSGVFEWRLGCGCNSATTGAQSCTLIKPSFTVGAYAVDYVPTTTAARYLPRLTHDPVTLSSLGLLVEGQATNEIGQHSLASPQMVTQTITVTAAQRTLSFYGTGTVTLSGAHSATVVGTGAYPSRRTLTFTPSAGSLTLTVSGTVQFPQQETGSVATSYIPNPGTGSAVRVADDWFLSGAALDAALGAARNNFTIYVEWFEPAGALVGNPRVMYLGTTDYSRRVDVYRNGSGVTVFVADGVVSTTVAQSPANAGAVNKLAISADGTNVRFVLNGSAGATLASVFGGAAMAARLLLLHAPGSSWMNTYVPAARAFPGRAMSIAEMQALTA